MIKERTANRETRWCPWCESDRPIGEFHTRKKGPQAGLPTAYCKTCNTDAIRFHTFQGLARKGLLVARIKKMKAILKDAERALREHADKDRNARALEIGLKILAEQEEQLNGPNR